MWPPPMPLGFERERRSSSSQSGAVGYRHLEVVYEIFIYLWKSRKILQTSDKEIYLVKDSKKDNRLNLKAKSSFSCRIIIWLLFN